MTIMMFTLITGLLYPLAMTGIGQILFPAQAGGSLVTYNGKVIGSKLIGQQFVSAKYFHGRPSSAGNGYDATNSSGSNFGPTSKALVKRISSDAAKLHAENPGVPIPVDLITSSASGLDPDITPAAALFQVPRIAKARNISPQSLDGLIQANTEGRLFGIIGEPHINVLKLNMALDAMRSPSS